ncbi:hypothetical protein NDU88_001309 [Pleurodeles waltl]|uniref:Uncharacterized protein n=1 Tax=Pleurodeles waltl TaxID=8319 RepID=A0AAV7LXA7_PLEWA|nr:hypothetical protein NDU88_001309 [Pleurodeles waltl]
MLLSPRHGRACRDQSAPEFRPSRRPRRVRAPSPTQQAEGVCRKISGEDGRGPFLLPLYARGGAVEGMGAAIFFSAVEPLGTLRRSAKRFLNSKFHSGATGGATTPSALRLPRLGKIWLS